MQMLSNEKEFITVSYIAEKLNVSSRTIYYDLDAIENNEQHQFIIERKPGFGIKGYWLVNDSGTHENKYSIRDAIFKMIVIDSETVSFEQLSQNLFVSKSSIRDVIHEIELDINKFADLKLIQDHEGTRLNGLENQIQDLMVLYNNYLIENLEGSATLELFAKNMKILYDSAIVEVVLGVFRNTDLPQLTMVAPYYQYNIFSVIVVLISRLCQRKYNEALKPEIMGKDVFAINNYAISEDILLTIKQTLDFEYTQADVFKLSKYLYGNKFGASDTSKSKNDKAVQDLIQRMSQAINEDLTDDALLFQSLKHHISHMSYRLENKIVVKNPILTHIIKDFRLMYDLVWLMLNAIQEVYDIKYNEDEVGFLALHFQSALDRRNKSRYVYVLTQDNFVSEAFILNRIRTIISPLDILKVVDVNQFKDINAQQIDFLISTIPTTRNFDPTIYVTPLITDEDLQLISQAYSKVLTQTQDNSNVSFTDFVTYDAIYFNQNGQSQEEIIKTITLDLEKKGIVTSLFHETVMEREAKTGTEMGNLYAIPHGSISQTNQTTINIWINRKSIAWGNDKAQIIILYAIAQKDIKKTKAIIKSLLHFANNNKDLAKKIQTYNKDTFYQFIKERIDAQ